VSSCCEQLVLWPVAFGQVAEHSLRFHRGLDNAGKTTIVKRILGEDVNEVSPTLGFNIRTIMHQGYSLNVCRCSYVYALPPTALLTSFDALQGTLEARPPSDPIGATTSRRRML